LNPGLDNFLIWGSRVFQNFQEYSIEGMMIQFISSCSTYASAGAIGTVAIGADYNAANATPVNQTELEYLSGTRLCKASDNLDFYLECDPKQNVSRQKFIRVGDVASGLDIRMYDWGKLFIASNGVPTASLNLGKIYVSYDIRAYKPKLGASAALNFSRYIATAGVADATPLGSAWTKQVDHNGLTMTATTITLPKGTFGKFYWVVQWTGTVATIVYPTITYTNATGLPYFSPTTAAGMNGPQASLANTTSMTLQGCFEISGPTAATVITFGTGGTLPGSPTCEFKLVEIPSDAA
jgi:hypothetical protein